MQDQQALHESKESFRYKSAGSSRIIALAEDMAEFLKKQNIQKRDTINFKKM